MSKKLNWDDAGVLYAMYQECPCLKPLFETGAASAWEIGQIATLRVVQANGFLVKERGEKPLFDTDLKTGKITMLRWHEDLLSALKIMAEQKKKLPDTTSVTVKTRPTTKSSKTKGKVYNQIQRMYNLGLLSKESAIEELQMGGFSWDEADTIVILWEGELT